VNPLQDEVGGALLDRVNSLNAVLAPVDDFDIQVVFEKLPGTLSTNRQFSQGLHNFTMQSTL
jgi:hypothetical protein